MIPACSTRDRELSDSRTLHMAKTHEDEEKKCSHVPREHHATRAKRAVEPRSAKTTTEAA